jgi:hypothetical protein
MKWRLKVRFVSTAGLSFWQDKDDGLYRLFQLLETWDDHFQVEAYWRKSQGVER